MKKFILVSALMLNVVFSWGQILTFDFAGLAGNEASANSNFNNGSIASSTITRGAGLTASTNAGRYNATNWAVTSIANAVSGNNYMQFVITPNSGCDFSISSIVIQVQRSATGPSQVALRSSVDAFASNLGGVQTITDNTTTQTFTFTFTQSNISTPTTYRFYMFAEASGGSGGIGDGTGNDLIVNGTTSCGSPATITTGVVSGGPFAVDCSTGDAGSSAFTSSGTFAVGNTFTVQLSSAAGSFASPTAIGTLTGASAEGLNPSGSINFSIPSATASGTGYLIRIISSNPSVTGTSSATNTVTLSGGPCTLEPPRLSSVIINSCDGLCTEGNNELVFGTSGDYAFTVNTTNFDFLYGSTFPGTNYTDILVNNTPTINLLNTAAGCGTLFIDATGTTVPANSNWMLASTALCDEALTWNGLCGSGPIYVIFQNDANWNAGGNFANNPSSPGTRYYRTNITTTVGTTFTIDYTTDGSYPNSDGVFATFDSDGGASTSYGDNDCILDPVLLPSELVSFYGMNNHEINSLYWQTASEQNNDYFTLSHSTDGYNFTELAQLDGAGNSDQTLSYSFDHTRPAAGINYYRLSSTDFDGTTYQKGIIALNTKSNLIFYNAITSSIELSSKSSVALYSLEGRLILTSEKTTHIPFNESGVYLLVNQLTGETERIFIPE